MDDIIISTRVVVADGGGDIVVVSQMDAYSLCSALLLTRALLQSRALYRECGAIWDTAVKQGHISQG